MTDMHAAVAALRARRPVILPTDTVYGLVSLPTEEAVARLYELKGRTPDRPTALVAATPSVVAKAPLPVPAMVLMFPSSPTLRTLLLP